MRRLLLTALSIAALAGCAHGKIPGTELDDTSDNHAILSVMDAYRVAVEAKDVQGIASLLDSTFKDDGGSTNADDDLDYQSAPQKLTERFAKLENVKLDMEVRKIRIKDGYAGAVYHYSTKFTVLGNNGVKYPQADSDIKEMGFKRVGGTWKIISGI
jgi:hypothetical protein